MDMFDRVAVSPCDNVHHPANSIHGHLLRGMRRADGPLDVAFNQWRVFVRGVAGKDMSLPELFAHTVNRRWAGVARNPGGEAMAARPLTR